MPKICIDAGHCSYGNDTGTEGQNLKEQDITLNIAQRLVQLLQYLKFQVVMTRNGDLVNGLSDGYTLNQSLQRRVEIANDFKADAFVSIHCNSADSNNADGFEILVDGLGGQAEQIAKKVEPYMAAISQADRGIKTQNVYVLKWTDMPAILLECGFLTNVQDAQNLSDSNYRQKIAVVLMKGICDYFGISYQGGGPTNLKVAILKYTPEDDWAAKDVDAKLGGVANFTRQGSDRKIIPADAMNTDQLIIIGGGSVGHKNEVLLTGKDKYETASKVAAYLK